MEPPFKPEIGCGCDPLVSGAQVAPEMELLGTIAHYPPSSYRVLAPSEREFKMVDCSFVVFFGICNMFQNISTILKYLKLDITHYPPSSRSFATFRFTMMMAPAF